MAGDPTRCEHHRMAGACEVCAHAAALADPRRAGVTRSELYPLPAAPTEWLPEGDEVVEVGPVAPSQASPRRKTGTPTVQ